MITKYNDNTQAVKIYKAIMSQTGTSNPTVVVLQNTIKSEITFVRTAQGNYSIYGDPEGSLGIFKSGLTILYPFSSPTQGIYIPISKLAWSDYAYTMNLVSQNEIQMRVIQTSNFSNQDWSTAAPGRKLLIHIEIYTEPIINL